MSLGIGTPGGSVLGIFCFLFCFLLFLLFSFFIVMNVIDTNWIRVDSPSQHPDTDNTQVTQRRDAWILPTFLFSLSVVTNETFVRICVDSPPHRPGPKIFGFTSPFVVVPTSLRTLPRPTKFVSTTEFFI